MAGVREAVGKVGERRRIQFDFQSETVMRLKVHCRLEGSDTTEFVEDLLLSYLAQNGEGRELFDRAEEDDGDEEADGE